MWRPGWVYARAGAKCGTYRAVSRTSKQQRRLAQPGSVPARLTGACEAWQGSDDQSLVDYTSLRHSLHGTIVQVCLDHWALPCSLFACTSPRLPLGASWAW